MTDIWNPSDVEAAEHEGDRHRRALSNALAAIGTSTGQALHAVEELAGPGIYDVEIAEGDVEAIRTSLANIRVSLAALRHLTRAVVDEPGTPMAKAGAR